MMTTKRKQQRKERRLYHRSRRAMIRAAAVQSPIIMEAVGIEWITAIDAGDGEASSKRFSINAYNGGPMRVANYDLPMVVDLVGLTATPPTAILRDHELSSVVGHADDIDKGESSLDLIGAVSGAGADAAEVKAAANAGFPWQASIGVLPDEPPEFVPRGVQVKVNGQTFTGPLYVARKATLREVSIVAVSADTTSTVSIAAAAAQYKEHDMDQNAKSFQNWIKAMGLSLDGPEDQIEPIRAKYDAAFGTWIEGLGLVAGELREDQLQHLRTAHVTQVEKERAAKPGKIEGAAAPPIGQAPTFDLDGVIFAHESHLAKIEATAEEYREKVPTDEWTKLTSAARLGAIEAKLKALTDMWPTVKLESEHILAAATYKADLMVAERPKGPAIHSSSRDVSMPAIEAAFCQSAGLAEPEKHFKPEVLEAADKYRGIGIQQLLLACAAQNGYSGRPWIRADNLREVIQAAFSVHTITTMLTSSANKLLLDGFNLLPQSWRQVAEVRSVSDFKAVTMFRMTADLEYEEVGPAGLIQHGTASQEEYSIQAKTYARMLALTRQDIINDDLGAFNDLRSRLGMGAAIKLNKVFWTAWLAAVNGAAFWTAARGNYQTGAATTLTEAGLNTAVKLFRDASGPDGNMLGLEPEILLSGSDLEATNRKLYTSQEMRDAPSSAETGTTMINNIYFNRFKPLIVPELSNAAYTGYSTTQWFLLCNPAILASAAMCFLDGQQSPTIESTDADFDTLGIQSRGYHDFGVTMSEWRASVHSVGA